MFDTKVQAIRDDLAGRFIDENRQPFHNGKGDIIHSHFGDNAIAFHAAIICSGKETFGLQFGKVIDLCRTGLVASVESVPQAANRKINTPQKYRRRANFVFIVSLLLL